MSANNEIVYIQTKDFEWQWVSREGCSEIKERIAVHNLMKKLENCIELETVALASKINKPILHYIPMIEEEKSPMIIVEIPKLYDMVIKNNQDINYFRLNEFTSEIVFKDGSIAMITT